MTDTTNTTDAHTRHQQRISKRAHSAHTALHRLSAGIAECQDWLDSVMRQSRLGLTDDKAWLEADESADALHDDAQDLMRLATYAYQTALALREAVRDAECDAEDAREAAREAAAAAADKAAGGAL